MQHHPFKKELTCRELEILKLFADGKTHKEIAEMLCISVDTVHTHKKRINQKIDIKAMYALLHSVLHDRKYSTLPAIKYSRPND